MVQRMTYTIQDANFSSRVPVVSWHHTVTRASDMYDRLATWTYAHRTKQGSRQLNLKRARIEAGMALPYRAERICLGTHGAPLGERTGESLFDHVNRGVKVAAIVWLSMQHEALIQAGWQLMHTELEASSIDLGEPETVTP